jgi:membrane AbrB-like protein
VLAWPLLLIATAAGAVLVSLAGVPGPALFAALLVGVAWSLLVGRGGMEVPRPAFVTAQAVVGVQIGLYLQVDTLEAVSADWLPVALAGVGTLAMTLLVGLLLARITDLDAPTASLGMVAGGASGIVAMSRELGADERLVAVMQYMRLLIVVMLTPLLAGAVFGASTRHAALGGTPFMTLDGLALTVGAGAVGLVLGRLVHAPAGAMIGPMVVSGALALSGAVHDVTVPDALQQLAFAAIGLEVGLRFTPAALRQARDTLVPVLGAIALLLVGCAALGWMLSELAGVSLLDGYLATTPGGLYAVLATAVASGANAPFVLAVQSLRLFAMVLAAPPIIRRLALAQRPAQTERSSANLS